MFACIYIPDFPVEAIVRAEPLLREKAVAILDGKPPLLRVIALNEKARLLGMAVGMTKLQAAVFADCSAANGPSIQKDRYETPCASGAVEESSLVSGHRFSRAAQVPSVDPPAPGRQRLCRDLTPDLPTGANGEPTRAAGTADHSAAPLVLDKKTFNSSTDNGDCNAAFSIGESLCPADAVKASKASVPLGTAERSPALQRRVTAGENLQPASADGRGSVQTSKKPGHIGLTRQPAKNAHTQAVALRQRSPEQEKSSHAALLDVAHAFTPRVEDTAHDRVLLDLAGLERLYGSPLQMAQELSSRTTATGMQASIGVAGNPDTAMHAACGFPGVTVVPEGEEAKRLGVLPLPILLDCFDMLGAPSFPSAGKAGNEKLRAQLLDTLERWGVRDFRTLSLLPEHALAARLGETGARLQRLARGAEMRTLALCEPQTHFEEALELECPVETLEPLSFVMNRLLEQLCARLQARALAAHELQVRLQLEPRVADEETTTSQELSNEKYDNAGPGAMFERSLRLPVAMRDAKIFLKLLQLELAAHPPGAPVAKLWISAQPAPPRSAQRGLFLPLTPEAEKLEVTLARISGIVGERRAGIARLLDTYRKDGFAMERFQAIQDSSISQASTPLSGIAPLALRICRPPRQIRVHTVDERPTAIATVGKRADDVELHGKILWAAGPWRSSGEWWTEQADGGSCGPWDREEWDIALADVSGKGIALYCIYRDMASGHWFVDASYD